MVVVMILESVLHSKKSKNEFSVSLVSGVLSPLGISTVFNCYVTG